MSHRTSNIVKRGFEHSLHLKRSAECSPILSTNFLRYKPQSAKPTVRHVHTSESSHIPRVADPSIWTSMIPTFLRRNPRKAVSKRSTDWNPATFFIVIFILIGSQSIRMVAEQRSILAFTRKTEAKIQLLRKVLESLRRGEEVDVEKMLGTGDEAKEREWEEVIKEIESQDSIWHSHVRKQEQRQAKPEESVQESDASPINRTAEVDGQKPPSSSFY